jgi:DNA-binding GntR family transcriptional regulator
MLRKARRIADALLDEDDPTEIEELDIQFHRVLYSGCGNSRLLIMIEDLRREGRRIYASQPKGGGERLSLFAEHQAILAACEEKDVEKAVNALSDHLTGTVRHIAQKEGNTS